MEKEESERTQYTWFSDAIGGESSPHTWEKLNDIDKRRRAVLRAVELPFWRILFHWEGTCLKVLVKDALLWASLACFVMVRIQAHTGNLPGYLVDLEDTNIDIIGGFLSFFLVLFVNQNNTRFSSMHHQSMSCIERITDVTYIVTSYFPKAKANRLVRYLNGAHAAAYVGLTSETYSTRNFFTRLNENHQFITTREMDRLSDIGLETGGDAFREILMWAVHEVHVAQNEQIIDARMSGEIREKIQKFRASMSSLYHGKEQPIHFFYIHFLSLLTAFYLPVFAIETAYGIGIPAVGETNWIAEIMSGLIVFLQAVFVIGLRLLGQVMVDPFGDDLEDLSVLHYVESTWETSNRILRTNFPSPVSAEEENQTIMNRSAGLGRPWDEQMTKSVSDSSQPPSFV